MFRKILSVVVLAAFLFNEVAFALSPQITSSVSDSTVKTAMHATAQKLFAVKKGPGSDLVKDIESAMEGVFVGSAPKIKGITFLGDSKTAKLPEGWENNPILRKTDLVEAFEYFRDNEASIPEDRLKIKEGYFEVDEAKGELPIARIEVERDGTYTLVLHTKFVQMWNHIRANDVLFRVDMPVVDSPEITEERTVSLAWGIFYRVAKHEMADITKSTSAGKGGGHLDKRNVWFKSMNIQDRTVEELLANKIGGRHSIINDSLWMWFLGSYCFDNATRYDQSMLEKRLWWFFGEGARQYRLSEEFPNLITGPSDYVKKNLDYTIDLALAVNYHFFKDRSGARVPQFGVSARLKEQYSVRKGRRKETFPATGISKQKPPVGTKYGSKVDQEATKALAANFVAIKTLLEKQLQDSNDPMLMHDSVTWITKSGGIVTRNIVDFNGLALRFRNDYDYRDVTRKHMNVEFFADRTLLIWSDDFASGAEDIGRYEHTIKGAGPKYFAVNKDMELFAVVSQEFLRRYEDQAAEAERLGLSVSPLLHFIAENDKKSLKGLTLLKPAPTGRSKPSVDMELDEKQITSTPTRAIVNIGGTKQVLLSIKPTEGKTLEEQATNAFKSIDDILAENGLTRDMVVTQSVFLRNEDDRKQMRELIGEFYGRSPPATGYIIQPPAEEGQLFAIEVTALKGRSVRNATNIRRMNENVTVVKEGNTTWVYVAGIEPAPGIEDTYKQALNAIHRMKEAVEEAGLDFSDVVRTWLYQRHIVVKEDGNDRYDKLNRARNEVFKKEGPQNGPIQFGARHFRQYSPGNILPPASTGIGMSAGTFSMACLAMASGDPQTQIIPIENPTQDSVWKYKIEKGRPLPLFSRGMAVLANNRNFVLISGTASVKGSKIIHEGDLENQTATTIENISLVLGQVGATVSDVPQIRIYIKPDKSGSKEADRANYLKVKSIVDTVFPDTAKIYLMGDVCRDGWLVEIEAVAFLPMRDDMASVVAEPKLKGVPVQEEERHTPLAYAKELNAMAHAGWASSKARAIALSSVSRNLNSFSRIKTDLDWLASPDEKSEEARAIALAALLASRERYAKDALIKIAGYEKSSLEAKAIALAALFANGERSAREELIRISIHDKAPQEARAIALANLLLSGYDDNAAADLKAITEYEDSSIEARAIAFSALLARGDESARQELVNMVDYSQCPYPAKAIALDALLSNSLKTKPSVDMELDSAGSSALSRQPSPFAFHVANKGSYYVITMPNGSEKRVKHHIIMKNMVGEIQEALKGTRIHVASDPAGQIVVTAEGTDYRKKMKLDQRFAENLMNRLNEAAEALKKAGLTIETTEAIKVPAVAPAPQALISSSEPAPETMGETFAALEKILLREGYESLRSPGLVKAMTGRIEGTYEWGRAGLISASRQGNITYFVGEDKDGVLRLSASIFNRPVFTAELGENDTQVATGADGRVYLIVKDAALSVLSKLCDGLAVSSETDKIPGGSSYEYIKFDSIRIISTISANKLNLIPYDPKSAPKTKPSVDMEYEEVSYYFKFPELNDEVLQKIVNATMGQDLLAGDLLGLFDQDMVRYGHILRGSSEQKVPSDKVRLSMVGVSLEMSAGEYFTFLREAAHRDQGKVITLMRYYTGMFREDSLIDRHFSPILAAIRQDIESGFLLGPVILELLYNARFMHDESEQSILSKMKTIAERADNPALKTLQVLREIRAESATEAPQPKPSVDMEYTANWTVLEQKYPDLQYVRSDLPGLMPAIEAILTNQKLAGLSSVVKFNVGRFAEKYITIVFVSTKPITNIQYHITFDPIYPGKFSFDLVTGTTVTIFDHVADTDMLEEVRGTFTLLDEYLAKLQPTVKSKPKPSVDMEFSLARSLREFVENEADLSLIKITINGTNSLKELKAARASILKLKDKLSRTSDMQVLQGIEEAQIAAISRDGKTQASNYVHIPSRQMRLCDNILRCLYNRTKELLSKSAPKTKPSVDMEFGSQDTYPFLSRFPASTAGYLDAVIDAVDQINSAGKLKAALENNDPDLVIALEAPGHAQKPRDIRIVCAPVERDGGTDYYFRLGYNDGDKAVSMYPMTPSELTGNILELSTASSYPVSAPQSEPSVDTGYRAAADESSYIGSVKTNLIASANTLNVTEIIILAQRLIQAAGENARPTIEEAIRILDGKRAYNMADALKDVLRDTTSWYARPAPQPKPPVDMEIMAKDEVIDAVARADMVVNILNGLLEAINKSWYAKNLAVSYRMSKDQVDIMIGERGQKEVFKLSIKELSGDDGRFTVEINSGSLTRSTGVLTTPEQLMTESMAMLDSLKSCPDFKAMVKRVACSSAASQTERHVFLTGKEAEAYLKGKYPDLRFDLQVYMATIEPHYLKLQVRNGQLVSLTNMWSGGTLRVEKTNPFVVEEGDALAIETVDGRTRMLYFRKSDIRADTFRELVQISAAEQLSYEAAIVASAPKSKPSVNIEVDDTRSLLRVENELRAAGKTVLTGERKIAALRSYADVMHIGVDQVLKDTDLYVVYRQPNNLVVSTVEAVLDMYAKSAESLVQSIADYTINYAPDAGPGSEKEGEILAPDSPAVENIYKSIGLLSENKIEIFVPSSVGITETVQNTLSKIRQNKGKRSVVCRMFDSEKRLKEMLATRTEDGVKRIVVSDNIATKKAINNLVEADPRIFTGVRLLSIVLPEGYDELNRQFQSVYQADIITRAILVRLLEKDGNPFVRSLLKSLIDERIEGEMVPDADAFMDNLIESENEARDPEAVLKRIRYCLDTMVNLVEKIGEQLIILRHFVWTAA